MSLEHPEHSPLTMSHPVHPRSKPPAHFFSSSSLADLARPIDADTQEEYLHIAQITCLQYSKQRELLYYALALFTSGLSLLICFWFPSLCHRLRYRGPVAADEADIVKVTDAHGDSTLCPIESMSIVSSTDRPSTWGFRLGACGLSPSAERMFVYRHTRFLMDPDSKQWLRLSHLEKANNATLFDRLQRGLSGADSVRNIYLYGLNALTLVVPSIPVLAVREVFHPFFVFQAYSVVLWCFESYFIFAFCIAFIATVSIVSTLIETRRRLTALSNMAKFECECRVLRDGQWQAISSLEVVPGDIIELNQQLSVLPCDVSLMLGGAVVNEAMLTGESVPVVKSPLDLQLPNRLDIPLGQDQRTTLFSATKILQLKCPPADGIAPLLANKVVGIVVRAGYATTKGNLILSILYPKPSSFKFVEQSYKFVFALFLLSLVGFIVATWRLHAIGASTATMIVRGLDLITIVVPPSLPLALSVGTNFALIALRAMNIYCISPARINMAGKVRVMCFDKTGTLTSEGMEFMGVLTTTNNSKQGNAAFDAFVSPPAAESPTSAAGDSGDTDKIAIQMRSDDDEQIEEATSAPSSFSSSVVVPRLASGVYPHEFLCCMAACHGLASLGGELIGDPLEIQIFKASHAELLDHHDGLRGYSSYIRLSPSSPQSAGALLAVQSTFEFQSQLQRMSVLACVAPLERPADGRVYCKGSPELLRGLCVAESLPADYSAVLHKYSSLGYRVIAAAYKQVDPTAASLQGLTKDQLREACERDLTFLGLIVLENKLKPESAPTLSVLRHAGIRNIMVTGDNGNTACTVARECELVAPGVRLYLGSLADDGVVWADVEEPGRLLDGRTLEPIGGPVGPYELAMTGPVYAHLSSQPSSAAPFSFFHRAVLCCQVFARMSPDQKAALVAQYQSLSLATGMCGDGSNDCQALKQGDIGISLSESEASIAAPFTYARPNIACVPLLLSEGRSSLMTSFQLFKYMGLYSMIQFTAVILCYFKGSVLGNWQYLFQDLFIVFPLTILIGSSQANRALSVKRPSGNLLSVANVWNVLSHMFLCFLFQWLVFAVAARQSDYVAYNEVAGFDNGPRTYEATSLYYFSNFQYIIMACLFAMGRPWKRPLYTNRRFVGWACVCSLASLLLLAVNAQSGFFMDEVSISGSWRGLMFFFVLLNVFVSVVWELWLFPRCFSSFKHWRRSQLGEMGRVFGRMKIIHGSECKEYHTLRGEFEKAWEKQ